MIVSLRFPLSRDTFSASPAILQQGAIPLLGALFYTDTSVQYAILQCIARCLCNTWWTFRIFFLLGGGEGGVQEPRRQGGGGFLIEIPRGGSPRTGEGGGTRGREGVCGEMWEGGLNIFFRAETPTKLRETNMKTSCHATAESIWGFEQYRCWASKLLFLKTGQKVLILCLSRNAKGRQKTSAITLFFFFVEILQNSPGRFKRGKGEGGIRIHLPVHCLRAPAPATVLSHKCCIPLLSKTRPNCTRQLLASTVSVHAIAAKSYSNKNHKKSQSKFSWATSGVQGEGLPVL